MKNVHKGRWVVKKNKIMSTLFVNDPLAQKAIIFTKFYKDWTKIVFYYYWPIFERVPFFGFVFAQTVDLMVLVVCKLCNMVVSHIDGKLSSLPVEQDSQTSGNIFRVYHAF